MSRAIRQILAGQVWTPRQRLTRQRVTLNNGKITALTPAPDTGLPDKEGFIDALDGILVPGLVDLQVNGALGWSFQATDRDHWPEIVAFHQRSGTTTFLPTLVSAPERALLDSLERLAAFLQTSSLPGIHLEGPFLSPKKCGAHDAGALRAPDLALMRRLEEAAGEKLRMVTLAPELPGALPLIEYLAKRGIVVAAGHSVATYDEMQRAVAAGLSFVTHAGNATDWPHRAVNASGLRVAEPGVVGALLAEPRLGGSVILDGYHFHPSLLSPLLRLKGPERLLLISDASPVVGCPPGDYESGGLDITVYPEGFATNRRDGEGLAGSSVSLLQAVRRAVRLAGVAPQDAVAMASLGPARRLGLASKGEIKAGADADLLLLNADLSLRQVIVQGRSMALTL